MAHPPITFSTTVPRGPVLDHLSAALGAPAGARERPVEGWNPPFCGDIDMRIAADGTWFYQGTPICRPALVRLFASILRRDPDRFVLVTPAERVGITVEDAPFLAVEMAVERHGAGRAIAFRTNVDDLVQVGPAHPLRFETDRHGGVKPYVLVRGGLWARLTRAVAYDLIGLGEERDPAGFGIGVDEEFFPISPAADQWERPCF